MNRSCANSNSTSHVHKQISNEDPLTGESGAHPLGTGLGAAVGGAATGAAIGAVAGPVGAIAELL